MLCDIPNTLFTAVDFRWIILTWKPNSITSVYEYTCDESIYAKQASHRVNLLQEYSDFTPPKIGFVAPGGPYRKRCHMYIWLSTRLW